VAPTAIPTRWLPHSVFDHGTHRTLTCTECHSKAAKSTDTVDVLMPEVKVCRACHSAAGGARTSCVECHLYHDKSQERDPNGLLTIRRLIGGR
jgi:predicted CXXCH cytochrome family protein